MSTHRIRSIVTSSFHGITESSRSFKPSHPPTTWNHHSSLCLTSLSFSAMGLDSVTLLSFSCFSGMLVLPPPEVKCKLLQAGDGAHSFPVIPLLSYSVHNRCSLFIKWVDIRQAASIFNVSVYSLTKENAPSQPPKCP